MAKAPDFYSSEDIEKIAACFTDDARIDRSTLRHQLNMAISRYFSIRQQTQEALSSSERLRKFERAGKHVDKAILALEHIPLQPSIKQRTLDSASKNLSKALNFLAALADDDLALLAFVSKDHSFNAFEQHISDIKSLMRECVERRETSPQYLAALHTLQRILGGVIEALHSRKKPDGSKERDWAFEELLIELEKIFLSYSVCIDTTKLSMEITHVDKPTFYYDPYSETARGHLGDFFQACLCPLYEKPQELLPPLKRQLAAEALLTAWKRIKKGD